MFGVAYIVSLRLSIVSLSQKIGSKSLNVSKISGIVSLPLIEKHGDASREPLKFMFLIRTSYAIIKRAKRKKNSGGIQRLHGVHNT